MEVDQLIHNVHGLLFEKINLLLNKKKIDGKISNQLFMLFFNYFC